MVDKGKVRELEGILRRMHVLLKRRLIGLLRDFEITPSQFRMLMFLRKNADCRMKDMVDRLHRRASTTSGIVDRLVKKDLVTRYRDEKDRRVVKVQLTAEGEKLIKDIRQKSLQGLERDLADFSCGEMEKLIRLLKKFCRSVE